MGKLTEERKNKLNKIEYEQTTWAARTWRAFSVQKISVAVQRAAALEIAYALEGDVAHSQLPRGTRGCLRMVGW